ncbi:MAG: hypothetical protein ACOX46_00250 [Limnochordia bacterium]
MVIMTISMLEAFAAGKHLEVPAKAKRRARVRKRVRKELFGSPLLV